MGTGVGSTVPVTTEIDSGHHAWLIQGAQPTLFYSQGYYYSGGFCSTVEQLNKFPVTDSHYGHTGNDAFDNRASWEGGPHWCTNFRSLHPGGAFFLYGDGHTSFVTEDINMGTYRALSTIQGREVVETP